MAWAVSLALAVGCLVLLWVLVFTWGYGLTEQIANSVLTMAAAAGIAFGLWVHRRARLDATPSRLGSEPFWFLVGIVAASILTVAVSAAAEPFRGPATGFVELGTPVVNAIAGVTITTIGLALVGAVWWLRWPRSLAVGLAVGAPLLGLGLLRQLRDYITVRDLAAHQPDA
jgi:hypothetical protein